MKPFFITFSTIVGIMILCLWKLCGIVVINGGKIVQRLLIISASNLVEECVRNAVVIGLKFSDLSERNIEHARCQQTGRRLLPVVIKKDSI